MSSSLVIPIPVSLRNQRTQIQQKKERKKNSRGHPHVSENKELSSLYVIVTVPLSGSGLIRISSSPASPSREGSVTLKNLNLSNASLALLETKETKKKKKKWVIKSVYSQN